MLAICECWCETSFASLLVAEEFLDSYSRFFCGFLISCEQGYTTDVEV